MRNNCELGAAALDYYIRLHNALSDGAEDIVDIGAASFASVRFCADNYAFVLMKTGTIRERKDEWLNARNELATRIMDVLMEFHREQELNSNASGSK